MTQKRMFVEPEIPELAPGEELVTLEDDPDPPEWTDHTVRDVRQAIKRRAYLSFQTDRLICGVPVKVSPNGLLVDIHLTKVFVRVGDQWQPCGEDRVIQGQLTGGKR